MEPIVQPSFRKILYGAVTGGAAYAATFIPSFEDLPGEVTTALPLVVAGITFWLIPERYLVKIGESFQKARSAE